MNVLVTGGCGFIGSHFIEEILKRDVVKRIINIDSMTYAANKILPFTNNIKYLFYKIDINEKEVYDLLVSHEIDHLIHFAAESHVDNSIKDSEPFIRTNINGTFNLLRKALEYGKLKKFIHVSTDEVFGSLSLEEKSFDNNSSYKPNSPYAASKAASDLLARSYYKTYKLPVIITNCSNNFGPRQFPEKMIPVCLNKLVNKEPIPLYGQGTNVRDWIYVKDHASAIIDVMLEGEVGKQYLIGGEKEINNFDLIHILKSKYSELTGINVDWNWFRYVEDRKGHDVRYGIDTTEFKTKFKNFKLTDFDLAIEETIKFYI
jgi:dTDP-glucose 4,6-dehydratase